AVLQLRDLVVGVAAAGPAALGPGQEPRREADRQLDMKCARVITRRALGRRRPLIDHEQRQRPGAARQLGRVRHVSLRDHELERLTVTAGREYILVGRNRNLALRPTRRSLPQYATDLVLDPGIIGPLDNQLECPGR